MYSYTLPLTSALHGGGWLKPRPGRLTPGKDPVPTVYEVACKTGAENLAPNEIRSLTVQPVACRYTDYANPTHGKPRMYTYTYIVNTQLRLGS
jgi:hypothetical protein